jgi:uncharacterized DUF497 family protein
MRIVDVIWRPEVIDKLIWKHGVDAEEVDQVLFGRPLFRKLQKGFISDEHVYAALGQTESGRHLTVIFIYKVSREALILTARDMDNSERKAYERR